MLLLPQLQFNILHKNCKHYTFYLSSEFERTQWIESIRVLQQSGECIVPGDLLWAFLNLTNAIVIGKRTKIKKTITKL